MPTAALRAIYRVNLGVRPSERVLVFTDRPSRRETLKAADALRRENLRHIALMAAETGKALCREITFVEYPAAGVHGKEPPRKLWEAAFGAKAVEALDKVELLRPILGKTIRGEKTGEAEKILLRYKRHAVDAVVALSHYSTSHTAFRQFLTTLCGARYASMPLFDANMLAGPMDVDWPAMAGRTREIAKVLRKAEHVRIRTPEGTDISFSTRGRKVHADTGIITRPGAFGNLPAGEVYLAPVEGTAEGRLVLLWAPTRKLASPVAVTVKGGRAEDVEGEDEFAGELAGRLRERKENANIAELGIGANPRASRPDNILESEKILGAVHIALGDNSSFGGTVRTPFHQDFVFFRPTVTLTTKTGEKLTLLENGKLLEGGSK